MQTLLRDLRRSLESTVREHHFAGAGKPITGGKGAVQVVDDYQLYGDVLVRRLAGDLTAQFGRGFGVVNLSQMCKFYTLWPMPQIFQTPSEKSAVPGSGRKLQTLSEKSSAARQNFPTLADIANRFPLPWSAYVRLLQ